MSKTNAKSARNDNKSVSIETTSNQASASAPAAIESQDPFAGMTDEQIQKILAARAEKRAEEARANRSADLNATLATVKTYGEKHGPEGMKLLIAEISALAPRRSRTVLSKERLAELDAELRANSKTAAKLAEDYGVSLATVNLRKGKLGLTHKRTPLNPAPAAS